MSQPPSSSDGEKARQSAEQAKSDEASFDNKSSLIVTSILTTELSSDNYSNKSNEVSNTYVSTERRNKNTSNGFFGSLFNSSIGLCSSRNINNQVVPIEQTSKPKVAQSSKSNFFTMTHSLKPKDVIDFVSSIQIEFAPDHDESTIFGNQNGLFLIKYSIVDTTTHPLTPFRSYMKRIISKETTSTSSIATTRNFDMLSSMIEILTEFIENLRKSEDGFFSTKESVDETMVSLEGCLALTVSVYI